VSRARSLAVVALACLSSACALFRPSEGPARLPEWQQEASRLRGLDFLEPVHAEWIGRDDFEPVIRGELGEALSGDAAVRARDSYAALGLLPADYDLEREMLELESNEVAGLYSPKHRTLYVGDPARDPNLPGPLGPTVVHELVHALQHQHYPQTLELVSSLHHEDDLTTSIAATLEGDATLTMLGAITLGSFARTPDVAEHMRDGVYAEALRADSRFAKAPRFVALSLLFPYAEGILLSARHFAAGGNSALDAALADPPLATLRVFRPELADPIEFVRLPLAALPSHMAPTHCRVGDDNTAGAFALSVLFELVPSQSFKLDPLAGEWRGDRFAQLYCDGDRWELVWLTRWRTPDAATRFAARYEALAPAIAARTKLSGPARVIVQDRTALVLTPGAMPLAAWLVDQSEIRAFADFESWIAAGCFPETACPAPNR
jgi:hypothetical protein